MGGLLIQGMQPGPDLFNKYADVTYTFFAGFVLVQIVMTALGLFGSRWFAKVSRLSDSILIPAIFALSVVGSYAIRNNMVDVIVMFLFGIIGYFVKKFDLNPAAIVLALILGPTGESGLRRSLALSGGNPMILCSSVVSIILIILCIFGIFSPIFMKKFEKQALGEDAVTDVASSN